MSDDDLAATLATEAGRLLLDVRREFADASVDDRKAAGDQRSHDFLMLSSSRGYSSHRSRASPRYSRECRFGGRSLWAFIWSMKTSSSSLCHSLSISASFVL